MAKHMCKICGLEVKPPNQLIHTYKSNLGRSTTEYMHQDCSKDVQKEIKGWRDLWATDRKTVADLHKLIDKDFGIDFGENEPLDRRVQLLITRYWKLFDASLERNT